MKDFIRKRLHENWGWENEPVTASPLYKEIDSISNSGYDIHQIQQALVDLEEKYVSKYAEYAGDTYGVIDAIKKVLPLQLRHIYDDMHPQVRNESINENSNIKKFIKIGMEAGFNDEKAAMAHYNKSLKELNSLPENITLYRVVFLNNPKDVNSTLIGSHYVLNKRDLENSHQEISHVGGGKAYILTVKVNKDLIDFEKTLINRMEYQHEKEITLINGGKGAKLVKVAPFVASKNYDDMIGVDGDFAGDFDNDFEFN